MTALPFIAAIGGLGLTGAGGLLGRRSARRRLRALEALARQSMQMYGDLATDYQSQYSSVIEDYTRDRESSIDQYRADFSRISDTYRQYFDQARDEYRTGMDQAIGTYATGRENTIAALRQQTERMQQATTARQAFTGLGQTTFGQQRVQDVQRQGMMQEGIVREEYARGLSSMEAARASGLSGITSQMGAGLASIMQAGVTGSATMESDIARNIALLQQQSISGSSALRQQGVAAYLGTMGQTIPMIGQGTQSFGNFIGSIGGSLFSAGLSGINFGGSGAGTQVASSTGIGQTPWNFNVQNMQGMPRFG